MKSYVDFASGLSDAVTAEANKLFEKIHGPYRGHELMACSSERPTDANCVRKVVLDDKEPDGWQ